ncbi:MAG: hypothetical protein GF414_00535 [Candidatus Altiarchaeales archaeon]|nr:hypothetical protein [Candidatus Altiarchaeales archaeon]
MKDEFRKGDRVELKAHDSKGTGLDKELPIGCKGTVMGLDGDMWPTVEFRNGDSIVTTEIAPKCLEFITPTRAVLHPEEADDLLSIFMADEESRYRQAKEIGCFYSVHTLNRLCDYWGVERVEPLPAKK